MKGQNQVKVHADFTAKIHMSKLMNPVSHAIINFKDRSVLFSPVYCRLSFTINPELRKENVSQNALYFPQCPSGLNVFSQVYRTRCSGIRTISGAGGLTLPAGNTVEPLKEGRATRSHRWFVWI